MTTEHDALHDLLAPVALGAADPTEIARVEAHAARCAICREELENLRAGVAMLAADVPQEEPSPRLKASLIEPAPPGSSESACVEGLSRLGDRLIILLDVERALP